jgi:hypothetical protein
MSDDNPNDDSVIAQFGPFKIIEGDGNNDFCLTDRLEQSYIGFDEEELADLLIVAEKAEGKILNDE